MLALDPASATAQMHLGVLDLSRARYESAIEHFSTAIQAFQKQESSKQDSRPELWGCYRLRGMAYHRLDRYQEAMEDYRSEVEASSGSDNAGCFLSGAALCQLGEYSLALETLRNSLQIEQFYYRNTCPSICLTWGSEGKLERARASYNGIVGESAVFLALTYARLGRIDEAQYWYDKATDLATTRGYFQRKGIWKLNVESTFREVGQILHRPWLVTPADNGPTDFDPAVGRAVVACSQPCFRIRLPLPEPDKSQPLGPYPVDLWCNNQALPASDYLVEVDAIGRLITIRPSDGRFAKGVYRVSLFAGDSQRAPSTDAKTAAVLDVEVLASDLGPRELSFPVTQNAQNAQNGGEAVQPEMSTPTIELISFGTAWKCLDDGSDQGRAWRETDFDESTWRTVCLPLKDEDGKTDALDRQIDGLPKPRTTYFRQCFELDSLRRIPVIQLDLRCSDGVAVYVNNERIVLENLAWDANNQTLADRRELRRGTGSSFFRPARLRIGKNCLAVEVHRHTPLATELDLDLRLSVPHPETISCDLSTGKGGEQIPARSAILRAELQIPRTAATSHLRRLRHESTLAEGLFDLPWRHEEPLQWGHDRGSTQIVFDVTDSVQVWCDGDKNCSWTLLPGDEKASVNDWIDQAILKVWFVPPQNLNDLVAALDKTHQAEWGLTAKRLRARVEAFGANESRDAR